jgi:gas vesicle protein
MADIVPDAIAGSAGWTSAGLAGLVLAWLLLKYLPAKDEQLRQLLDAQDKQLKETIESHSTQTKDLATSFNQASKEMRSEFRDMLQVILSQSERSVTGLGTSIQKDTERLTQAIDGLRDAVSEMRNTPRS